MHSFNNDWPRSEEVIVKCCGTRGWTHLGWGRCWWEYPPPCTAERTASFQPRWTPWTSPSRTRLGPRQTPSSPPPRARHRETWTAPRPQLWRSLRESSGYFRPLIQNQGHHSRRHFLKEKLYIFKVEASFWCLWLDCFNVFLKGVNAFMISIFSRGKKNYRESQLLSQITKGMSLLPSLVIEFLCGSIINDDGSPDLH